MRIFSLQTQNSGKYNDGVKPKARDCPEAESACQYAAQQQKTGLATGL
jgi:hypothetical protein